MPRHLLFQKRNIRLIFTGLAGVWCDQGLQDGWHQHGDDRRGSPGHGRLAKKLGIIESGGQVLAKAGAEQNGRYPVKETVKTAGVFAWVSPEYHAGSFKKYAFDSYITNFYLSML